MKEYPLSKYRFYYKTNKDGSKETYALSTYAGKTVKGKAVCLPEDTYDEDFGKRLAAARCNAKVAKKRYENSVNRYENAEEIYVKARFNLDNATNYVTEMRAYKDDSEKALNKAFADIEFLLLDKSLPEN